VQTQIGASSFRVDLGVVHPDAPGTYLCGVECDGATYHRSATARDRDMLREQVLRGLGWEIVRIWSTDWWIDRAGTLEKVHVALERLLEISRQTRDRQKEREEAAAAAEEAIAKARAETGVPVETIRPADTEIVAQADAAAEISNDASTATHRHVEFHAPDVAGSADPEAFFDPSYDDQLRRMIEEVAAAEAPVRDTVLARRIARAHGWQRTGARIQDRVSSIALSCLKSTEEDVGVFFWTHDRVLRFRSRSVVSRKRGGMSKKSVWLSL
jgi:hypothetical protein